MAVPAEALQGRPSVMRVSSAQSSREPISVPGAARFRDRRIVAGARRVGAIGTAITAALVTLAACTSADTGSNSSSTAKPDKSTSASPFPSPDQSPTRITGQPTGGICSPSETRHAVVGENGIAIDDSQRGGVVVSFLVDRGYNDPAAPGPSLEMLLGYKVGKSGQRYTRVASIEVSGNGGAGGLIDDTQLTPDLNASHPVTGIEAGDRYTVLVGTGNTPTGEMDARKYTVDVGRADELGVTFDGCAPLGAQLPSYRGGTPQP